MVTEQTIKDYINELKMLLEYENDRKAAVIINDRFTFIDWYTKQIKKFEDKLRSNENECKL